MSTSTETFEETPESELAQQQGREGNHPFELGRQAALDGKALEVNPFPHRSKDALAFKRGWSAVIAEKSKGNGAGETPPAEESKAPKTHRPPKPGVQAELIPDSRVVGKTDDGVVELPEEIKVLLEPTDDAMYHAAIYKTRENEFRKQMQDLMAANKINEVTLPPRGKLVYKPGKPSTQYIPPKEAKKGEGEGEGGE